MVANTSEDCATSAGRAHLQIIAPGSAPGDLLEWRAQPEPTWLVPPPPTAPTPASLASTQLALAQAPLPVVIVTDRGTVVWHNEALTRLLRGPVPPSLDGLIAMSAPSITAPDHGNRLSTPRGPVPVHVQAWEVGEPGWNALVIRDVSEEAWARASLDEARRWQDRLLESEADAVLILDIHGTVLVVGPAVGTLLERSTEEWPGAPVPLAFAEDRARARRAIEEVLVAPARRAPLRWRVLDGRGRTRWMEGVLSNQLDNPLVQGLVLESRDATEQHELQATLRRDDRMRTANLLGATIAHDMNNMVALLTAGLERSGALAATETEALRRISELARRLLAVGQSQGLPVQRVDLGRVVMDLRGLFQPLLGQAQRLEIELDAGEHPVRVDVGMLEQALMNLVINARDAMGPTGRLRVRVRRPTSAGRPMVALEVEDDGTGMDEATQSRLFEPFFTTKGAKAGSGLGTLVVQTFAHDHEGTVTVRSIPGEGTCISIGLPIAIEP